MARKETGDNKDEVREQIIEAASNIFRRYGFKKTTMDDIALGVNKGKSSIYYYFTSKDQVFQAVVEKEIMLLRKDLLEVVNSSLDPAQKLESYILVRMTKFGQLTNYYYAIKNEYMSQLQFIDEIRKKYDEDEVNLVDIILREGSTQGIFIIEDSRLAATVIVTAMKGLEIPLFWLNGDDDFESRLKNVTKILFNGILKR